VRTPTPAEIEALRHEASSVHVRTRGRLVALRVTCPDDVDAGALVTELQAALDATPLRGVELLVQRDAGELRVLGAVLG
jgi:hypothetical protein